MRALYVLIMIAVAGCSSAGSSGPASADNTGAPPPSETAAPAPAIETAEPEASATPAADAAPAAELLDLTRGKRIDAHGLRIMLRSTATDHRSTAPTLLRAELEARSGDEERKIKLERVEGGDPQFVELFDLQVALESVDAAAKPSTARILVRK